MLPCDGVALLRSTAPLTLVTLPVDCCEATKSSLSPSPSVSCQQQHSLRHGMRIGAELWGGGGGDVPCGRGESAWIGSAPPPSPPCRQRHQRIGRRRRGGGVSALRAGPRTDWLPPSVALSILPATSLLMTALCHCARIWVRGGAGRRGWVGTCFAG